MVGQPRILTQDGAPPLVLGDLSYQPEPSTLDASLCTYFSPKTVGKFKDIRANGRQSANYRRMQDNNNLTWITHEPDSYGISIGANGLEASTDEYLPSGWCQAESWLTLFDPVYRGRGFASRTYRHALCAGLAMGLDVIYAPVHTENQASIKLHERCGFVALREFEEEGRPYYDMRLFHPRLRANAIVQAVRIAGGQRFRQSTSVDEQMRISLGLVNDMLSRLSYVQDLVDEHPDVRERFLRNYPRSARP